MAKPLAYIQHRISDGPCNRQLLLRSWSRDTRDLSLLLYTAFESEASVSHPPLMLERHGTVLSHPCGGEGQEELFGTQNAATWYLKENDSTTAVNSDPTFRRFSTSILNISCFSAVKILKEPWKRGLQCVSGQ